MKVKVISRSEEQFTKERREDLQRVFKNLDPALHPLEKAHEYTRALNAVKLEKVFAKPFMGALSGHRDGISSMAKNPQRLNALFTGSHDGEIRLWDVAFKRTTRLFLGHSGAVTGLAVSADGESVASCGADCTVRLWPVPAIHVGDSVGDNVEEEEPLAVFQGKNGFRAVDFQSRGRLFGTAGVNVDIWDPERSRPVSSFSWGADSVISIRFSPAESDVMATTGSDRSVALYDLRMSTPLRKIIMQTKCNAVAWNPREAFNLTVANEDCNCYSYDMRNFKTATCIHKGHVSAVMDIDYSPTGRDFVTGSYDRTVRLFEYNGGNSREVYHTKRMQRVFCVKYSGDATYVLSGSDDTNVRVWKARAAEQMGVLLPREKRKQAYMEKVKERYKFLPEIKRIDRHRHLPKGVYKAGKMRQVVDQSEKRKDKRRRAHSAPDSIPSIAARKKKIVTELE